MKESVRKELALSTEETFSQLRMELSALADEQRAVQQSAYMRNQFPYFGVPTPQRRKAAQGVLRNLRGAVDWDFVDLCWNAPEREFQYVAADHLKENAKTLKAADLPCVESLVQRKSWWDSVDHLAQSVCVVVLGDTNSGEVMRQWARHPNFWVRRVSIISQLGAKELTDTGLLTEVILANTGSQEFFINKAIGWALRQYARIDPVWVRDFLSDHEDTLAPLSIREASKHL